MEDAERRLSYQYQRVLLETTRVLSPQFDDTLICLTGAELELLRNVCTYFHLRSSFVSQYDETYYLCPDDDDWDDIQAIVADLEEKLMGCKIYRETWAEEKTGTATGGGNAVANFTTVPAGEIWQLQFVKAYHDAGVAKALQFAVYDPSTLYTFYYDASVLSGEIAVATVPITIAPGQNLRMLAFAPGDGKKIYAQAFGYKMDL